MAIILDKFQEDAIRKLQNGNILCGGVGSGKSRTALAYYVRAQGATITGYSGLAGKRHLSKRTGKMEKPESLYIITTARKRDTMEWEEELAPFALGSSDIAIKESGVKVIVDSWNNIGKYASVTNSFFIFDEQRVIGNGTWVKSFLKITKSNNWILLSATPGDTWQDYIPVFIANGFYKNRTQFYDQHVVWSRFAKYPKIDRYWNIERLVRLRDKILVDIETPRQTVRHYSDIVCDHDRLMYKKVMETRWDIYKNEPIQQASVLCGTLRRIVNSDDERVDKILDILSKHRKLIIFYNYDYELEILKTIKYPKGVEVAEWNGHAHQPIPESETWVYLVQYNAGCEGWNCIQTDTIVFYSQTYSWKVFEQASGRIDRRNTPFTDLYYYTLISRAPIDLAIRRALKSKKMFNERKWVDGKSH